MLSYSVNKAELSDESKQLINDIKEKKLQPPVEILKFLQNIFVKVDLLVLQIYAQPRKGK